MRKRRRLADKLTIMVCAVLVAVSAFFYVPMDVEASDISLSGNLQPFKPLNGSLNGVSIGVPFGSGFDDDEYYRVSYDFDLILNTDALSTLRSVFLRYGNHLVFADQSVSPNNQLSHHLSGSSYIILKGSDLNKGHFYLYFRALSSTDPAPSVFSVDFSHNITSSTVLTGEESESYQNGYNVGYSVGEQAGESNGYSNGYSDGFEAGEQSGYDSGFEAGEQSGYGSGFEAGEQSGYDSGFQAGQDSVDTQSYYDMGYSAGYDAGYLIGYDDGFDDGYDAGWQAYEDKISGWGADTSDYPVYITSSFSESGFLSGYVYGNSQVYDAENIILNFDINPNHIYRFDVKLGFPRQASYSNVYGSYTAVYFCAGGVDYFISPSVNLEQGVYESIYVRGDMLSSSFSKKGVVNVVSASVTNPDLPASFSFTGFGHDVKVYDVGPIGNMQNHIANQTDQLTGGYNDSQGNSVNNDFSSGLNEFETAEDSLFANATTGLKDFTFFDIQSVPAMVTGMSFVGSIMSGWFTQAGGASGVGIVLSILFSIMLVAMVLGLYRWYQSKGGKD